MSPLPSERPSGHGFPMRLIDRVESRGPGMVTVTCGIAADGFLHADRVDPSNPWPAALVIEALAQAALPIAGGGGGIVAEGEMTIAVGAR